MKIKFTCLKCGNVSFVNGPDECQKADCGGKLRHEILGARDRAVVFTDEEISAILTDVQHILDHVVLVPKSRATREEIVTKLEAAVE